MESRTPPSKFPVYATSVFSMSTSTTRAVSALGELEDTALGIDDIGAALTGEVATPATPAPSFRCLTPGVDIVGEGCRTGKTTTT